MHKLLHQRADYSHVRQEMQLPLIPTIAQRLCWIAPSVHLLVRLKHVWVTSHCHDIPPQSLIGVVQSSVSESTLQVMRATILFIGV